MNAVYFKLSFKISEIRGARTFCRQRKFKAGEQCRNIYRGRVGNESLDQALISHLAGSDYINDLLCLLNLLGTAWYLVCQIEQRDV